MKIGVHSNESRDIGFKFANEVVNYLQSKNVEVTKIFEFDFGAHDSISSGLDYVIVLGGDGTILNYIQRLSDKSVKILGINNGKIGYLTDVESSNVFDAIDNMLTSEYKIEERIMVTCKIGDKEQIALNDVYINKMQHENIVEVNVCVNNSMLESFRGDGVIVSTPTGSTAYNLSAGGSILKPDGNMLAITPICPHMLYARPVIVDGDDLIKLSVNLKDDEKAYTYVDGSFFGEISNKDKVVIQKSEQKVRLIKTQDRNFYNVLKDKMLK